MNAISRYVGASAMKARQSEWFASVDAAALRGSAPRWTTGTLRGHSRRDLVITHARAIAEVATSKTVAAGQARMR